MNDTVRDLLEDESYFVEGEDVYVDVTASIFSYKSAQRDEYRKSNRGAEEHFKKSLELYKERVREVPRRWNEVFERLLPTTTVERLRSMDLELLDDQQNASVR